MGTSLREGSDSSVFMKPLLVYVSVLHLKKPLNVLQTNLRRCRGAKSQDKFQSAILNFPQPPVYINTEIFPNIELQDVAEALAALISI